MTKLRERGKLKKKPKNKMKPNILFLIPLIFSDNKTATTTTAKKTIRKESPKKDDQKLQLFDTMDERNLKSLQPNHHKFHTNTKYAIT